MMPQHIAPLKPVKEKMYSEFGVKLLCAAAMGAGRDFNTKWTEWWEAMQSVMFEKLPKQ